MVLVALAVTAAVGATLLDAALPERVPPGGLASIVDGPREAPRSPAASPRPPATLGARDTEEGIDAHVPVRPPRRVELYAGSVSILPGQPLLLHVSTPASRYGYVVDRLDATLPAAMQQTAQATNRPGHDYRALATFDATTRVARANWPVTDTVRTAGWIPGVYLVTATDSLRTRGRAIFVVRTPVLRHDRPAFVWSALTYEAYNLWGGANLYDYAAPRAVRVSFARPYAGDDGAGYWSRDDAVILAWLQRRGLGLQYTTDYDLSVSPPAVAPRLLVFARHTEYVAAGLYDFVTRHVDVIGDMNLLNFGSNSFYWQVRLAAPRAPGEPRDIVCYKDAAADPVRTTDPALTTTQWGAAPVDRPAGMTLGAQYAGVLASGFTRFDFVVTSRMPGALLDGTGWRAGTSVGKLLLGEGDATYPGSGGIPIIAGLAYGPHGLPLIADATIRTSPAGARVFDAGTFAWGDGFGPATALLGVSPAAFDRFNRNVLAWLGCPARS